MDLSDYGIIFVGLTGAIVFLVTSLYLYYVNLYRFWAKRGVKGPKPFFYGGNVLPMLWRNRTELESQWFREYGKIYSFYLGMKPTLTVADPQVLRQICIKDFDSFVNHDRFEFTNKYQRNFLVGLEDEHWKRVRAIMSPTFTSGKIKRMFKLLNACADDLVLLFREQLAPNTVEPKALNIKDLYGLYTMDAIATCCYGLKLERDGSTNLKAAASRNDFVRIAMIMFKMSVMRILIMLFVNKSLLKWLEFQILPDSYIKPLADRVEKLIRARKASDRKFDDYLQLLIDAKMDDNLELSEMDAQENHHAGLTHDSMMQDQARISSSLNNDQSANTSKSMTDDEILTNATFLLVVGLETTASLLTFCTYTLAFHQEIQERLYQEVKAIADYDESREDQTVKFDYDKLTSCQYLDSVLSETLRKFPPAISTDRSTKEDYLIEKYNVRVPKGTRINLNLYLIMNDPDNWHEPEKFDPERFMPGNRELIVPGSYCPFGLGPRHCIGMRFSLTEAKLAMAKMIMNYKFEPAPRTSFPPAPKTSFGLNGIKNPLVNVKLRSD